jgi:hypothetical protein
MRGYVVEKCGRLYAVIYERLDPITGRERRADRRRRPRGPPIIHQSNKFPR